MKLYNEFICLSKLHDRKNLGVFNFVLTKNQGQDFKKLIMNYNIFLIAAEKNKNNLSLANKNFLGYLKVFKSLLEEKNTLEDLKKIEDRGHKFFLFINFVLKNKFPVDFQDLENFYQEEFINCLKIENDNDILKKTLDWQNLQEFIVYFSSKSENNNSSNSPSPLKTTRNISRKRLIHTPVLFLILL